MTARKTHWERTYTAKDETAVSWFQPEAARSLALIRAAAPDNAAAIIDIGGGASRLADGLLAEGYTDLTVLDLSETALDRAKARIGSRAGGVSWIAADILEWVPQRRWDVWHDRAVFHFLTETAEQNTYIEAMKRGTKPGSTIIMATFAPSGPERCSGLPVQRYSPATLARRLGTAFALYDEAAETHHTPFGTTQDFIYAAFRRR